MITTWNRIWMAIYAIILLSGFVSLVLPIDWFGVVMVTWACFLGIWIAVFGILFKGLG